MIQRESPQTAEIAALQRAIHAQAVLHDEPVPLFAFNPPRATISAQGMRRRQTFLVIEDNPDDEALIARAFADSGVNASIAVARDGEEALLWLKANPDVSFLLLDLNLPRMNGVELLQNLRQDPKLRNLPVVVFTSSNAARDLERAYRAGATSYVQKPIHYTEFAETIKTILQYWLKMNTGARQAL